MRRVINFLDKVVDSIILFVCIFLLLLGVYAIMDNAYVYNSAFDRSLLRYKPVSAEVVIDEDNRISKNHIAWLVVDDTNIDYPIMQGTDNIEYVNKDPYGSYSLSGSIFLDFRNDSLFTDSYSLLYGHHMNGDHMFGVLDKYLDEEFFNTHKTGTLTTKEETYKLEAFAVIIGDATDEYLFNPLDISLNGRLNYLRNEMKYYDGHNIENNVLAVTTCSNEGTFVRLIVLFEILDIQE